MRLGPYGSCTQPSCGRRFFLSLLEVRICVLAFICIGLGWNRRCNGHRNCHIRILQQILPRTTGALPYMCHDSLIFVPWLILMCAMVTCEIDEFYHGRQARCDMCAMAHSYVWHDSFICVTWLIHLCAMTHSYVWHDSFLCMPWLSHTCAITHPYVCWFCHGRQARCRVAKTHNVPQVAGHFSQKNH